MSDRPRAPMPAPEQPSRARRLQERPGLTDAGSAERPVKAQRWCPGALPARGPRVWPRTSRWLSAWPVLWTWLARRVWPAERAWLAERARPACVRSTSWPPKNRCRPAKSLSRRRRGLQSQLQTQPQAASAGSAWSTMPKSCSPSLRPNSIPAPIPIPLIRLMKAKWRENPTRVWRKTDYTQASRVRSLDRPRQACVFLLS